MQVSYEIHDLKDSLVGTMRVLILFVVVLVSAWAQQKAGESVKVRQTLEQFR